MPSLLQLPCWSTEKPSLIFLLLNLHLRASLAKMQRVRGPHDFSTTLSSEFQTVSPFSCPAGLFVPRAPEELSPFSYRYVVEVSFLEEWQSCWAHLLLSGRCLVGRPG